MHMYTLEIGPNRSGENNEGRFENQRELEDGAQSIWITSGGFKIWGIYSLFYPFWVTQRMSCVQELPDAIFCPRIFSFTDVSMFQVLWVKEQISLYWRTVYIWCGDDVLGRALMNFLTLSLLSHLWMSRREAEAVRPISLDIPGKHTSAITVSRLQYPLLMRLREVKQFAEVMTLGGLVRIQNKASLSLTSFFF